LPVAGRFREAGLDEHGRDARGRLRSRRDDRGAEIADRDNILDVFIDCPDGLCELHSTAAV
jgi:hypothetical protein